MSKRDRYWHHKPAYEGERHAWVNRGLWFVFSWQQGHPHLECTDFRDGGSR